MIIKELPANAAECTHALFVTEEEYSVMHSLLASVDDDTREVHVKLGVTVSKLSGRMFQQMFCVGTHDSVHKSFKKLGRS